MIFSSFRRGAVAMLHSALFLLEDEGWQTALREITEPPRQDKNLTLVIIGIQVSGIENTAPTTINFPKKNVTNVTDLS